MLKGKELVAFLLSHIDVIKKEAAILIILINRFTADNDKNAFISYYVSHTFTSQKEFDEFIKTFIDPSPTMTKIRDLFIENFKKAIVNKDIKDVKDVKGLDAGLSTDKDAHLVFKNKPVFKNKAIPKIIHFIWVGGKLPKDYLANILKAKNLAPGFKIYLWTNNPRVLAQAHREIEHFNAIQIRSIETLFPIMEKTYTLSAYKNFLNYLYIEMVGLKNLAGASDLLRLEILRQFGGVYLDTDVIITKRLSIPEPNNGFLCPLGKLNSQLNADTFTFNNNVLLSAPDHPILHDSILIGLMNYQLLESTPVLSSTQYKQDLDLKRNELKETRTTKKPLGHMNTFDEEKAAVEKDNKKLGQLFAPVKNLMLMDLKRGSHLFPIFSVGEPGDSRKLNRFSLTVSYSAGPGAITKAICDYADSHGFSVYRFCIPTTLPDEGLSYSTFGGIITVCDNTWLKVDKSEHAFDDSALYDRKYRI